MSEGTFQVIAATPRRSHKEVAELAERIGDLFDVDLGTLLDALSRTGVCVATADNIAEARAKGARIIGVGADYRVLDSAGKQVDIGEAKSPAPVAPRSSGRSSRTMIGIGSHLVGMAAKGPELEDRGGFIGENANLTDGAMELGGKEEEIELEDSGGFAAIDSSIAEGGVELGGTAAKKIQLDETGGFAAMDSSIAEGAVELAAGAQKIELEDTSGGFASAQSPKVADSGIAVPASSEKVELEGPGGFIAADAVISDGAMAIDDAESAVSLPIPPPVLQSPPPAASGSGLDALDGDALMMLDGTDDHSKESECQIPSAAVDDSSFMPPEEDELDMDALDIEMPSASPAPPSEAPPADDAADDAAVMAPLVGEVVEVPAHAPVEELPPTPAPSNQSVPAPAPTRDVVASQEVKASLGATTQRAGHRGSFLLLDGWFSDRPRIRVIVGFLAALIFASVLPICHTRSIRTARIEELRIDLATAKAHGAAVAGNRTPTEIEASISSLQTRHTIYALAMWCALMGLLLLLWFRFS